MSNEIKLVFAGVGIAVSGFVAGHYLRKHMLQKMRAAKVEKKAEVDNVAVFEALMKKYNVPVDNNIDVGHTDYLDKPVKDRLFCGVDKYGRAFVNLPYIACKNDAEQVSGAMVVFQRYTDNRSVFVTGGAQTSVIGNLLGPTNRDLSDLERLLSGSPVRFVDSVRNTWIDMVLKP